MLMISPISPLDLPYISPTVSVHVGEADQLVDDLVGDREVEHQQHLVRVRVRVSVRVRVRVMELQLDSSNIW